MRLETLRDVVVRCFPELSRSTFTVLMEGWDSIAVDVDGRLIFKFPRHEEASARLRREAGLLAVIRPAVTMPVPDLALHDGPPLFSRHAKLPGEHLLSRHYETMPETARQRLAADMALFYAELHGLDARTMEAAGAGPVEPWPGPDEILRGAWPMLTPDLRRWAERTITAWRELPHDPHGTTYGFFDGHGWNMAFDHAAMRLNGVYDFADSGFGALHQEFIASDWIGPDLTDRIAAAYEGLTGRALDRRRIELLSSVLRLSELAQFGHDPAHAPAMLQNVADWAARDRLDGRGAGALQRSRRHAVQTKAEP